MELPKHKLFQIVPPTPPSLLIPSSSIFFRNRNKRHFSSTSLKAVDATVDNMHPHNNIIQSATQKSVDSSQANDNNNNNNNTVNLNQHNGVAAVSSKGDEHLVSTTKDTAVVLITLAIIFFTLVATYFLWRKHRGSSLSAASHCNRLEEYRYSRLSQNDVEVDNITFQGDLTHKTLINSVPVCGEEESADGDQVCPATLRLDYDSLVTTTSNDGKNSRGHTRNSNSASTVEDNPVNLLINELSDEDLLQ